MVPGFNHNFAYNGTLYHVQTEDGGRKRPAIVTLLFSGGTVLASRTTDYADILGSDLLEQAVAALMKEQHQGMLRSLKHGEFDEAIARARGAAPDAPPTAAQEASPAAAPVTRPEGSGTPTAASPPPPGTDLARRSPDCLAGEGE